MSDKDFKDVQEEDVKQSGGFYLFFALWMVISIIWLLNGGAADGAWWAFGIGIGLLVLNAVMNWVDAQEAVMAGLLEVAALVGAATIFADEAAHRDELAARRFRELNPSVVQSKLDRSRNRRWHRVGLRQRLVVVLVAANVVLALAGWLAFAVAAVLMGAVVSLVFDISFNIRLGLPWWYAGHHGLDGMSG